VRTYSIFLLLPAILLSIVSIAQLPAGGIRPKALSMFCKRYDVRRTCNEDHNQGAESLTLDSQFPRARGPSRFRHTRIRGHRYPG
jgi:hypothetical protein